MKQWLERARLWWRRRHPYPVIGAMPLQILTQRGAWRN